MVPAFTVFCLMIDCRTVDLDFAAGKVALEIGTVLHSIPETEFYIRKQFQLFLHITAVCESDAHEKAVPAFRNDQFLANADPVFFRFNDRISEAVAAAVAVRFCLYGLPARVPDRSSVPDINAEAFGIQRAVIITVAGQPPQPGVAVKCITAGCVAQKDEKVFAAEVIDPGQRRAGSRDHIFPVLIIEKSVFHSRLL